MAMPTTRKQRPAYTVYYTKYLVTRGLDKFYNRGLSALSCKHVVGSMAVDTGKWAISKSEGTKRARARCDVLAYKFYVYREISAIHPNLILNHTITTRHTQYPMCLYRNYGLFDVERSMCVFVWTHACLE